MGQFMKISFKAIAVLILVLGAVCVASATEDTARVDTAGEQLGQGLSELKNSVSRLVAGNEILAAANARLKTQADALRSRLKGLKTEEDRMSAQAAKLKVTSVPDTQRIAKMEKELSEAAPAQDPSARKEKLKILKMIYDSKQVQQQLIERIFGARQAMPAASLSGR